MSSSARKRRFVSVAQRVLEDLQGGQLQAGDRLPPDRVLATDLEVSRATIREALLALELLGVVEIRHGSGVYVVDPSARSQTADERWLTPPTTSLFEARTAVEPKIARLCAIRMSPDELEQATVSVARAREVVENDGAYNRFTEVQLEFHSLLMKACCNPILADVNRQLMSIEEHPLWALLNQQVLNTREKRLQQVVEHEQILAFVRERRPEDAAAAMGTHLTDLGRAVAGSDWIP